MGANAACAPRIESVSDGSPLARTDIDGEPLATFQGDPAILYPYIDGTSGGAMDWNVALPQTAEAIARLHELTEGFEIPYERTASGTESRRMIRQLADGCAARGIGIAESALADMLNRSEQALHEHERKLQSARTGLRYGVVHHDAHPWNVLFSEGKLVGLIDFDDAHEGFLVSDVAVMVNNWASEQDPDLLLDVRKAVTVAEAYDRSRPLTSIERQMLPDFILLHLLSDSASFVWGRLGQGKGSSEAIAECRQYRRYLHHARDDSWARELRRALAS